MKHEIDLNNRNSYHKDMFNDDVYFQYIRAKILEVKLYYELFWIS